MLHNKPLGCGASEVYASGPDSEEEEEEEEEEEKVCSKTVLCILVIQMLLESHHCREDRILCLMHCVSQGLLSKSPKRELL